MAKAKAGKKAKATEAEAVVTNAEGTQPEELAQEAKQTDGHRPEEPASQEPEPDPRNGVTTLETRILACQCGSTRFDVTKRTKTAVALVCMKCGLRASVKGNLATIRVRQQEIQYALAHTVVTPDDEPTESTETEEPGESVGDGTGQVGQEYVTLRFRIMAGDQKDVIDRAMEAVRVMNCAEDRFREQTWQGHALEFICADFLSGCRQDVLQIVDAMDAAVEDAHRLAEQDGKPEPKAKKIRDLRTKVRDKLAVESGLLPADALDFEERQMDLPVAPVDEDGGEEPDESAPSKAPDSGRLLRAVAKSLEAYNEESRGAGVPEEDLPEYMVRDGAVPTADLVERWTRGGYLIKVLGDKRTVGDDGKRPAVCAWIAAEPAELALDFSVEYDDQTDEILGDGEVEVVELLPPDYKEIPPWDQPHFADRREVLR